LWKVLVPGPETLEKVTPESDLTVGDLDGKPLVFKSTKVVNPYSSYFHSCCAVWKSTYLEQPDRSPEEFWARFQHNMSDLWGDHEDRTSILNTFKPTELLKSEESDQRMAKVDEVPSAATEKAERAKFEKPVGVPASKERNDAEKLQHAKIEEVKEMSLERSLEGLSVRSDSVTHQLSSF
jgi:hypothetical protein